MSDLTGRPRVSAYIAAGLKDWLVKRAEELGMDQTGLFTRILLNYREAVEHDMRPGATNWRLEVARLEGRIRDLLSEWLDQAAGLREHEEAIAVGGRGRATQIETMVLHAQDRLLQRTGPQPLTAQMLIVMARDLHQLGGVNGHHETPEYTRGLTDLLREATGLPRETCERMLTV